MSSYPPLSDTLSLWVELGEVTINRIEVPHFPTVVLVAEGKINLTLSYILILITIRKHLPQGLHPTPEHSLSVCIEFSPDGEKEFWNIDFSSLFLPYCG